MGIEHGHEWIYRVTAGPESASPECKYFLTAYEARAWKARVEALGVEVAVARAPATAFADVDAFALASLANSAD